MPPHNETLEVKMARIETRVEGIQDDLHEMKDDMKLLKTAVNTNARTFTFLKGSWHTITLLAVVAWTVVKAIIWHS